MNFLSEVLGVDKPFERITISGGQTEGYMVPPEPSANSFQGRRRGLGGSEYAHSIRQREEERERQQMLLHEAAMSARDPMTNVDDLTSLGTVANVGELEREELTLVYETYDFEKQKPSGFSKLAVFDHEESILNMICTYRVCVIKGKTGCGKTTQIPQMILDAHFKAKRHCNIIVTQPRRIAAITVANRVSEERNWPLGSIVGYQVGLEKKVNSDTRLTYCTTGCLLQKLIVAKHMNDYTHIILDEVHERDQDMDFLMLVVRKFQRTVSPQVKVILMSATINTSAFTQYFSTPNGDEAPVIEVSSKTNYPVSIYYLDSFEQRLGNFPEVAEANPKIDEKSYQYVEKIIQACDYIDKEEAKLYNNKTGSILVFLPGLHEIEELYELLEVIQRQKGEKKWWICPLHSTVTADEQLRAFKAPPHQLRKIILSTNIAESSVTVPDIKYVIDFCLTKVMYADPDTNLSSLHMCWASKNQCEQRAGRVGRVMPGRVYRLVPKSFYDYCMEEEGKPEILRCPLESVVLKCKLLEMGEPIEILALAMDPPDLNRLEQTVLLLKETGALLMTVNGEYSSLDGDLTTLGRIMAALPLDVKISKLIYLGHIFSVLEDTIIMGCAMTVKSMFSKPFKQDLQAYISKLTWADSTCSDSIACLNAYRLWRHSKTQGSFDRSAGTGAKGWGKRFFIQLNAMTEIARLQDEVTQRLKMFKIEKITSRNRVNWDHFTKPLIMKIVIAGAFYPHYFVRSQSGGQVNESDAVKLLSGRDPFSTVYLTNFPPNQPGILYANSIREHFKGCGVESSNVKVSFDQSSKVYIEFKDSNTGSQVQNNDGRNFTYAIPGKVSMAVYRALKMRHYTSSSVTILVLPPEEAKRQMKKIEEAKKKEKQIDKTSILPSLLISFVEIRVTHVNDAGNFYVQYSDQEHHSKLIQMHECLNRSGLLHKLSGLPVKNKLYAVQFKDPDGTNEFYRALILDVENRVAKVLFVDYGNVENVAMSSICTFDTVHRIPTSYGMEEINLETEPYLAFKCTLACIQPSLIKNHRALWSRDANNEFKKYCCNRNLMAKVYSVVDNVAALEVYISGNETHTRTKRYDEDARALVTINERLVELKLAEWNEESYLSKVDHELRETQQNCESVYGSAVESRSTSTDWVNSDVLAFLKKQCRKPIRLKGPNSPLEMTVYSCVQSNLKKQVFIEQDSVNSILLDTHPHDPHERMLVAASVGQSAGGERLTLRYTTILPNIHGLSALICLLFCPYAEFRVNEAGTRFTGALCGLGWDPEIEEPYFPENDLEVTFDTSFNLDDIQVINKLRYRMNIFMCNSDTHDPMEFSLHETIDHQKKVEDLITQLLAILAEQKTERMESCHESYVWGQIDDSKLLHPGAEEPWFTYRLHYGVNLEDEPATFEPNERLKKNILELKEIASGRAPIKGAMCNLCQVSLDNVRSLKLHLQSTQHNDLAKRYNLIQLNH